MAVKAEIRTIAEKNRITANIINEAAGGTSFLLLGHKDPDADCLASLVAAALLLSKFQKYVTIYLPCPVIEQLDYLLAICRYNDINVVQDKNVPLGTDFSAVVILDTPKPDMILKNEQIDELLQDPRMRKIELDHHLEADSWYSGDPGYCLVSQASSTCELIGYLSLKVAIRLKRSGRGGGSDFFSRNIALAILTGIVGDSQMGRYLKTNRERWYYSIFSEIFHHLLAQKTIKGSRNMSSMEDIFKVIQSLSEQETHCFNEMKKHLKTFPSIKSISIGEDESEKLFKHYGNEVLVNVAKSAADKLAEDCGKLGLVGYYDDPGLSDLVQFRLRRSCHFTSLDLRDVLREFGIHNGGGHPGAIGFRISKGEIRNIEDFTSDFCSRIEKLTANL
ncbi:MAG: DHH family phosphoesterase [Treponema sp.]|jgi:nanoRNase/pAp phosphatase (c-di-AMP/oligoRNAs hydrolase)|nr:DHH family phosphoesterase [Treponema sp.]